LEKKWDFFATGLLGFGSNKNPTNSPQYITILGNPYQNTSFNNKIDSFTEAFVSAGVKYHLESQNESSLFSSLALYNRHYNQYSTVDLLNLNLNLGYEHQVLGGKNIYTISTSKTDLGNKPFVNSYALNLIHEHFIGSKLKTLFGITTGYNKHQECGSCASSDTRTNTLNAINAGVTLGLTDKWIIDASGGFSDFSAKAEYESFTQSNGILATTYSLPLGNVSLGKNYNFSRYDGLDPLANIRREITLNTNYFSFITAPLHLRVPMRDDWALKINTQWGKSESPILTYQKDILETSLSVIKSF
jgi:opacity protein-like surface antigen